jgi:hypothetical protein
MNLAKGPEYYINTYTSGLLIDSSTIYPGSTAIVYLSSIATPGYSVSVRDSTGYLSTNKYITLSTTKDVFFQDQQSTFSFNAPYGFATLKNNSSTSWQLTNLYSYPFSPSSLNTFLGTSNIQVSTISCEYINTNTIASQSYYDASDSTLDVSGMSITIQNASVSTINNFQYPINLSKITVSSLYFYNTPEKVFGETTLSQGFSSIQNLLYAGSNSLFFTQRKFSSLTPGRLGHLIASPSTFGASTFFEVQSYTDGGTPFDGDNSTFYWMLFNIKMP